MSKPRLSSLTAAALALTFVMSACTLGANRDVSVRAQLDYDNEVIIFPLSAYQISDADISTAVRARETIFERCLAESGVPHVRSGPGSANRNRRYGIWNVERAKAFGFGDEDPNDDNRSAQAQDPKWQAGRTRCLQENGEALEKVTPASLRDVDLKADRIAVDAAEKAAGEREWSAAIDEWRQCISSQGLTPRTEEGAWTSQQASDLSADQATAGSDKDAESKEREIRIATIEAQCNIDVRLTQRLADLEAGYQAALMRGEEATLEQEKADNARVLAAAREVIASGG